MILPSSLRRDETHHAAPYIHVPYDGMCAANDIARTASSTGTCKCIKNWLRTTAKISSAALATSTTMHAYFTKRHSQSHNFMLYGKIACKNDDDTTLYATCSPIEQWGRITSCPSSVHSQAMEIALLRPAKMR